jgi:hypothetical protein
VAVIGDVDGVAGHRLEHRRHEHDLQRRRPVAGADRRQHGVPELLDLERAWRLQVDVGVGRERHRSDVTGTVFSSGSWLRVRPGSGPKREDQAQSDSSGGSA